MDKKELEFSELESVSGGADVRHDEAGARPGDVRYRPSHAGIFLDTSKIAIDLGPAGIISERDMDGESTKPDDPRLTPPVWPN